MNVLTMSYTEKDVTLVICAYQECEFLEECIRSVKAQTKQPAKIIISTSTPNDFISQLAEKYDLDMRVNPKGGHANDYNFALEQAETNLCAMAHQDDLIAADFVEKSLVALNKAKRPLLAFTNYAEIHDGKIEEINTMLRVKRFLLWPTKIHLFENMVWHKRWLIRFGNTICHPTVTYVMKELPAVRFQQKYRSNLDWDLWERMSLQHGAFVYCPDVLLYHRMHKGQATAVLVEGTSARQNEDIDLLGRFWPKWFVKIFMTGYSRSEKFY